MTGLFIKSGFNNIYYSTPRSFARFGLLLMNKGVWNGTDLLKDSNYFKAMITSSQSLNKAYGYLTWLNGKESYMLPDVQFTFNGPICLDAPADMYAALGKNGQIINVVPSQNLVFIRMGNMWTTSNVPNVFNNDVWKRLKQVICSEGTGSIKPVNQNHLVYPNPSVGFLEIDDIDYQDYEIYSILGKKLLSGAKQNRISITNLPNGTYFIHLITGDGSLVSRVKLQKNK
jgi:hypothetical protein